MLEVPVTIGPTLQWKPRRHKRIVKRPQTHWTDDIKAKAGKNYHRVPRDRGEWKGRWEAYVQEWTVKSCWRRRRSKTKKNPKLGWSEIPHPQYPPDLVPTRLPSFSGPSKFNSKKLTLLKMQPDTLLWMKKLSYFDSYRILSYLELLFLKTGI